MNPAIARLLAAIVFFDLMGAIIKHLGEIYPVQQLSMLRNLFGLVPSLMLLYFSPVWHQAGKPILIRQWKLGLIRGVFIAVAQFCFYLSLIHMEFATASTFCWTPLLPSKSPPGDLPGYPTAPKGLPRTP